MTSRETAVLIFDGDCGFCTTTANYIKKHTSTPMEIHPWQWIDLSAYGLTKEQASAKVQVYEDGKNYAGHAAFAKILRLQKQWWFKLLGAILVIPPFSWGARVGYHFVAKYRHKLPSGTPACELPKTTR
jgi:predicted DCC family thiol-disulfide oxidoreductase YuxK